jgi:hypothetical protein
MIPKKLFTSFKPDLNKCKDCQGVINKWQSLNKDFEVKYFSDEDVKDFYKDFDFGNKIYSILSNGTAIADFFRISYIYKNGGIWFDFDMEPFQLSSKFDLKELDYNENLFFDLGHKNISYMLISGKKNSKLFINAINFISKRVLSMASLTQGKNVYPGLQVVGPHAFQNYISSEFNVKAIDGFFPADNKIHHSKNSLEFKYLTCYNLKKKTENYRTISNTHHTKHWREHHI